MAFTTKHGRWFPFIEHIRIHDEVLEKYTYLMVSPIEYSFDYIQEDILRHFVEFEFLHNAYKIKIEKHSKLKRKKDSRTGQLEPFEALTVYYNYVARNSGKGHHLRYCSPHESFYNSELPWHHKHHKHESTLKTSETVSIFDDDDRPSPDQSNNQLHLNGKSINIRYLGKTDWPNVSDFLKEVSGLV